MAASEGTHRARGARWWPLRWWRGHAGGDGRYATGIVAALAYYYLVPNPLLALPGLAAFAALAWLRLELALCLLPLTFPFWYVPKRALGHMVFPLSEIALGVCLAVTIGHLLLGWMRGDGERGGRGGNAEDAEKEEHLITEGAEETKGREESATAEERGGYREWRKLANGQWRSSSARSASETTAQGAAPSESISLTSAASAKLRELRVLRILYRMRWRWLAIGALLLLVGTAAGVLVAVRPREALRAFRWEVAEPLLYAALLIAWLWRRAAQDPSARAGGGSRQHQSTWLIGWLAGPTVAVGALFGLLGLAQVLWLRVTFTPLAAGNQLVTLPPVVGGSLLRATGIYYGSANSLGALLERVLPLALALLLWRMLGGTGNAEDAQARRDGEKYTTEGTEETEGRAEGEQSGTAEDAEDGAPTPSFNRVGVRRVASAGGGNPTLSSSVPSVSSVVNLSGSPASHRTRWEAGEVLLMAGCLLVMVAGLALTGSRGAEVGAAAGLLLVLLAHPRTRRITLGTVVLGGIVALWQGGTLMQAALAGHGASGEVRLLLWQSALHMIRDHPLLGIGPDQFLYYYDPAYTAHPYWIPRIGGRLTPAAFQPNLAHPHNLALDLWLSGGVLGLAGFALVLGWLAWGCWRLWRANARRPVDTPRRWTARTALVVGVAGGVFAGLAHGMVDSAYFQPDLALLFWWAVATVALLCVGLPAQDAAPSSPPKEQPGAA